MPNLKHLIEHGVMGNLATLYPVLSPMLWTRIATGERADKHGIHGFHLVTPFPRCHRSAGARRPGASAQPRQADLGCRPRGAPAASRLGAAPTVPRT